jgi:hypothetical protein
MVAALMARSGARGPWFGFAAALPLACVVDALLARPASAHVKWFCAYNVAGQPDGLENVLCLDFEKLTGLSVVALLAGSVLEGTPLGVAMLRAFAPHATCASTLKRFSVQPRRSSSCRFGGWAVSC